MQCGPARRSDSKLIPEDLVVVRIRIVALIIPLCFIGILRSAPSVAAGVTVDQGSPSVHSRLGSESAAKAHVYAYDVMPSVATGHECCARAEASLLPRSVRPITDASSWLRGTPAGRVTTRSELVATNTPLKSPVIDPAEVAGKTPAEIDALAKQKGLIPKGPDPAGGRGAYVDPVTGEQRILCHPDGCGGGHVHVNDPSGQRLGINGKPVAPESPEAHLPGKFK